MSSSVVTVAFGRVPRTSARHDGQVYGLVVRRERAAEVACHENHSFKQDPQKVCRQSSRVKGWYMTSVQICPGNISQHLRRLSFRLKAVYGIAYRACQLLLQHQTAAAAATRALRHDGLRVGRSGRWAGIIVNSLPLSSGGAQRAASVTMALVAPACSLQSRALAMSCHTRSRYIACYHKRQVGRFALAYSIIRVETKFCLGPTRVLGIEYDGGLDVA